MSTHNDAAYLAESIESVLSQDLADFELITVNDGSPDPRTAGILSDYAARDVRIRVVAKANEGLTKALIDGCAVAQGEYIARIDVGDVMTPDRLRRQAQVLDGHPEVAFVSCWTEFCGPEWEHLWVEKGTEPGEHTSGRGSCRRTTDRPEHAEGDRHRAGVGAGTRDSGLGTPSSPPASEGWIADVLPDTPGGNLKAGPTCHPSVMMRSDAYRRSGGYRWQFYYAQDWDLWHRLAEVGHFACVQAVLYRCRILPSGISMTQVGRQRRLASCIRDATLARSHQQSEEPFLEEASRVRPGDAGAHRGVAWRQRGAGQYFLASCLRRNGDVRWRRYLLESLRLNPWRGKAWLYLLAPASGRPSPG